MGRYANGFYSLKLVLVTIIVIIFTFNKIV